MTNERGEMPKLCQRCGYDDLVDHRHECSTIYCQMCGFNNREAKLKALLKDALYILEGSRAIEGQSDEELLKREDALRRVIEWRQGND